MSEQPTPENEKSRRSRSFGSFAIVLVVLLLVLAVVGNETFQGNEKLSQDKYEWLLNKGDIKSQEFKGSEQGTNLIQGVYTGPKGDVNFEVRYASLEGREQLFQDLLARDYVTISAAA